MSTTTTDRTSRIGDIAIKAPCKAASTGNLTLSGEQTVDGVALVTGDRCLVKNQTAGANNGIYVVDTGTWTRSTDFDGPYDIATGTLVLVIAGGAVNGNTMWEVTATGAITIGTTSIVFTSAALNDSSTVTFLQAGTGAVSRSLQSKARETFSVKDFGAVGDGSTNDSPAFQLAFNAAASATYGARIYLPAGSYRLNILVTYSGKAVQVIGDGIELSKLLVNNANGALQFTFTTTTVTVDFLTMSGFSVVANTGTNCGVAIKASWPNTSTLPSSPQAILRDLYIRSNVYGINVASNPYFTTCLQLVNAAATRIEDVFISQIGNTVGTGLYLNNSAASSAFFVRMRDCDFEGLQYGVLQDGWLESAHINGCDFVSPQFGLWFNNNTATPQLPLLRIQNTHINAVRRGGYFKSFKDIQISGHNITIFNDAQNTTDAIVYGLHFEGCALVRVSDGYVGSFPNASTGVATSAELIYLQDCSDVEITDNQLDVSLGGSQATAYGVNVGVDSTRVKVHDNQFRTALGSAGITYVLVKPDTFSNERTHVFDNEFNDGSVGVRFTDIANGSIRNNRFDATTTGISITGSTVPKSASLICMGNAPRQNQTLTNNSATPSVGSALNEWFQASNSGATTITNFTEGYDGQTINIYFSNGNTTIQNNANIITKSGANFTGAADGVAILTLIYGVWRMSETRP
jgi:hypothetical protein